MKVRIKCLTEVGDGKGFHYWTETQDVVDDTIGCGDHPAADVEDFTIVSNNNEDAIEDIVKNAMAFFNNISVKYAAENIAMGITAAGKTKDVADYLKEVIRYGQTGSLYEVINEIDALVAATVPGNLSPFVTETRLEEFKAKVEAYLGV